MTDLANPAILDSMNHIAIVVKEIKPAVDWYTKQFKCLVEHQDESWAYLRFSNINLALVIPEQHPGHIAFSIENANRYGTLKRHRDGTESVYISDPDGNAVELIDANSLKSS